MNTHTHRHTHTHTDTQISDCSSSLASAEMEILLGMGNKPRFGGSGKIGWARLTETGENDVSNVSGYDSVVVYLVDN